MVDSTDYIVDGLKGMLTPQRFEHSRGVEGEAVRLAELYGADVQVCKIAGLLHDCARDMSYQDLLRTAEEHPGSAPEDCKNIPILLHSFVGAVVAKEKFGITDERILNSIRIHTLGDVDMTLEEKEAFGAGALRRAVVEGDEQNGCFMAGEISGMVRREQTCEEMIKEIFAQAETVLKGAQKWVK